MTNHQRPQAQDLYDDLIAEADEADPEWTEREAGRYTLVRTMPGIVEVFQWVDNTPVHRATRVTH